ncbi:MAG: outer membrane lipoprotein-sorting protein [Deltaproteobacteria bacterium]|uniref:outer membrane lipoprotein-sorting protein n=1 Tax=Desulfobacula sp. TaxID=2593537 RepID=UPI0019CC295A|nr:outer membrane lipoprotein-sorting protein [Candidatus Desulfobacula maris]MBL6995283.1 outer membrane lipoprotein-sorting protein [Desulfobacula sp.]
MKYLKLFITILLLNLPGQAWPTDMEKAIALLAQSDLSRGNVSGIEWDIDIETESEGKIQKNTLQVLVKGTNCLAIYQTPAKMKGRKLLMKDRNMWFIKPGLSKPVPISPRQKLLGGASNGDIASTNYAGDYTIESITQDLLKTEPCFLYELKARTKNVTYDRIRYWVSLPRKIGLKAEFFTLSGKMFKIAFFEYDNTIMLNGQEQPFVSKMTIKNAMVETEKTIMAYHDINIREISASAFNLNLLVK